MQWSKSLVWVIPDFVQKWKVKFKKSLTGPISLKSWDFCFIHTKYETGRSFLLHILCARKNEDYILGGGKNPRPLGVLQFLPVGEMCLF